jgi:hypothetical protein
MRTSSTSVGSFVRRISRQDRTGVVEGAGMAAWHPIDEEVHELIEDESLIWVVEDRLDEPVEPWVEMNRDD